MAFLMNCDDLLQQIGLYLTLEKVEHAEQFYKTVVGARLLHHFWEKLSKEDEIEAHRNEALLAIAEFVKTHPRASEQETLAEIEKQIRNFVHKMES
ncbi:uncharacterized protein LOC135396595 isoform X2 [Ornithodoros turicata]|uniref:uncharacterized protein LOC135396595 isoform X2 n=1 Tax=Ornithodoros turicata TaxID=34597 RepID=UPI003139ACCE